MLRKVIPLVIVLNLVLMIFNTQILVTAHASERISVRLAYQGPISGGEKSVGNDQLNAVKYAVKLFNAANSKYNVQIVEVDDQGDPAIALTIAPGIESDKSIIGLVGSAYSGATLASLPYYRPGGLALISPSATRVSLTDAKSLAFGGPVFHRVIATDNKQGEALAKLATLKVPYPNVFIIDDQSAYAVPLRGYIENAMKTILGATLVGGDSVPNTTTDFSPTIAKIKTAGANVVIFAGYYSQAAVFVKQLRDSGSKAIFAGGDGVFNQEFLKLAGAAAEGSRLTTNTVALSKISEELERDYQSKMGMSSGAYAAESIDAVNVFLTCIARGVVARSTMLTCVKGFEGKSIYGENISFDSNGDVTGSRFHWFGIKDGVFNLMDLKIFNSGNILDNFPWNLPVQPTTTAIPSPTPSEADKIVADAKAKALQILAEANAKVEADKIVADAKEQALQILAEGKVAALAKKESLKKVTITCTKGKLTRKIIAVKPVCPSGYKKK